MNALEAARKSLETADKALEQHYTDTYADCRGGQQYLSQRGEITEQWLKLAAIEKNLNPWASTPETGDPR